jgi:hypothetical protein
MPGRSLVVLRDTLANTITLLWNNLKPLLDVIVDQENTGEKTNTMCTATLSLIQPILLLLVYKPVTQEWMLMTSMEVLNVLMLTPEWLSLSKEPVWTFLHAKAVMSGVVSGKNVYLLV